LIFYLWCVQNI